MFFEYHFHGCAGHKTIELNRKAYEEMSVFLLKRGQTDAFLAAFSAAPIANLVECLEFCRDLMNSRPLPGAQLGPQSSDGSATMESVGTCRSGGYGLNANFGFRSQSTNNTARVRASQIVRPSRAAMIGDTMMEWNASTVAYPYYMIPRVVVSAANLGSGATSDWGAYSSSVKIIIESSTKGGSPIRKVWSVSLTRDEDDEMKPKVLSLSSVDD